MSADAGARAGPRISLRVCQAVPLLWLKQFGRHPRLGLHKLPRWHPEQYRKKSGLSPTGKKVIAHDEDIIMLDHVGLDHGGSALDELAAHLAD